MMKNRTKPFSYALPLTAVLTLGCGSGPSEGSASASASSTDSSDTSASASASTSDPTPGSNSNSDSTPTTTQGSVSDGQTEATTAVTTGTTSVGSNSNTDTSATSNSVTSDTDGTTTTGDSTSTTTDSTTTGELSASTSSSSTTGDSSSSGTTGEPLQCGLQLKATIRDFKIGHPDFETYCCGVVKDLVKPDLGADKKPVFNQVGNPKMLTDAPTFNQWYNNVQDVNQSTQIILDLMEIQPGVYSYQNNNFFPIDNMLFGNQGNNHNFHFTTQHDTS